MKAVEIEDFVLHVGDVGGELRCALLRHPGDTWIGSGSVSVLVDGHESSDLLLRVGEDAFLLAGVRHHHLSCIKEYGLLVLQKPNLATEADVTLLKWVCE